MPLPDPIQSFFDADTSTSRNALAAAFAADAIVRDEGHTYHGLPQIEAWWHAAKRKYDHHAVPFEVRDVDGLVQVCAVVTGNFPGSPATLTYRFDLDSDRIASLEITA